MNKNNLVMSMISYFKNCLRNLRIKKNYKSYEKNLITKFSLII